MPEIAIPKEAKTEPGPCPKCGGDGPVMTVRSKTDRNWWDEWKGCLACVAPIGFATELMDKSGNYGLYLDGIKPPKRRGAREG